MKKIAIFDFDGTLFQMPKQDWKGTDFCWDTFMRSMMDAPLIESVAKQWVKLKQEGFYIILCSARPMAYMNMTHTKLRQFGLEPDEFALRTEDDLRAERIDQDKVSGASSEAARAVSHHHHSLHRKRLINRLSENDQIWYAFDDQKDNLYEFLKVGAECYFVDGVRCLPFDCERCGGVGEHTADTFSMNAANNEYVECKLCQAD